MCDVEMNHSITPAKVTVKNINVCTVGEEKQQLMLCQVLELTCLCCTRYRG